MSTSAAVPESGESSPTLRDLLREARARRRLSQWDLALELGISQRHLSFVELGRSRPSRELLLRWLDHLEVPLVIRNQALLAAGFAPAFHDDVWAHASLTEARFAARHLLRSHEPWPALLLDPRWDLLAANRGVAWLLDAVGSDVIAPGIEDDGEDRPTLNLLDLALGDLGAAVLNLDEAVASLLDQLRHEMVTEPSLRPRVETIESLFPSSTAPLRFPPMLTTRYATRHGELEFISMFTTFGAPHSVTLASLRIELMFPANALTRSALSGA